jgi:glucokinase
MKDIVIGIDIGGTFTKYGLVTREGDVLHEGSVPTDVHSDVRLFLADLKTWLDRALAKEPFNLKGIGVGAPNGNYYKGTIDFAPNLKWKGIVPLAELFHELFPVPVILTNDANAAALGEMIYGNARGMKDFIMITLGTGVGSGIVVNGEMVYGHDGFAGELGHTTVDINGRKCGCGRRGCLETYASANGIKRTVFELLASENDESDLRNIPYNELDSLKISEAAMRGDKIALKAFDYTGKILAMKLSDAVAHTSPEAFILFGGLSCAGYLITDPLRKYFEEFLLPVYRNKIKILPSALQDKNIAVMGAAAIMWKKLV